MDLEEAQNIAGSIWCKPTTQHKVMDPELALVFADTLMVEVNSRVQETFMDLGKALKRSGMRRRLRMKLTTLLMTYNGHGESYCQNLADQCLDLLFPVVKKEDVE